MFRSSTILAHYFSPFMWALNGYGEFMNILEVGDTGSFQELSAKNNLENLVISYIPPIEGMLERAKQLKGEELSDGEIARIRSNAPAVALPDDVHKATFGDMNQ